MPDYNLAAKMAYLYLVLYAPPILPIDVFSLSRQSDKKIKIIPFSSWKKMVKIEEEMIDILGSEYGVTIYDIQKKMYLIIINDKKCHCIQRWTIAHELGHIFLGHLENEEYVAKGRTIAECVESNNSGDKFEKEANTFAKHLLAPFPIIKKVVEALGDYNIQPYILEEIFEISPVASKNIIKHLEKLYYLPSNYLLEEKFRGTLFLENNY